MRLTFLGTGTCVQNTINQAQSSILIEGNSKMLVDCGAGTFLRLHDVKVHVNSLDAILLTHIHLDHCSDLFTILKARWLENGNSIDIYGPHGTEQFLESLLEAFSYLRNKINFTVHEENKFSIKDSNIAAIDSFHSIKSRAYVIECCEKKVVISGDTMPFRELFSLDCDVLIHELSLPFGSVTTDHTTPENIVEFLKDCRADVIYFTHIYPHAYSRIDEILNYLSKHANCTLRIAKDLEVVEV